MLKDKLLSFPERQKLSMLPLLTDLGTEYCDKVEQHHYQLYPAIIDIVHTKTEATSQKTNGICERFHKTILNELNRVTFGKNTLLNDEGTTKDLDE